MPFPPFILLFLCLLISPTVSIAFDLPKTEAFHTSLSLQGFSGIMNTPSAHVQDEGNFQTLYSNQIDQSFRKTANWQDNYLFSIGLFNFTELGGRLTNTMFPGGIRDLSASVKFSSAPLTRSIPYFPVLATGLQDIGGGANHLQARYVVMSEDLWRLRLSAGYGFGPNRMKGLFGGAEFKAHDWVYLLGEYDSKEMNAGLRLITPEIWKTPVRLIATAKTSFDYKPGNIDFAFGLSFPLDFKRPIKEAPPSISGSSEALDRPNAEVRKDELQHAMNLTPGEPDKSLLSPSPAAGLERLRDKLVATGLSDIKVGQREGRELVVAYENRIFNHNELDALGIVSGIVSQYAPDSYETICIIIKRKGIMMARLRAPLPCLRAAILREDGLNDLRDTLAVDFENDDSDVVYTSQSYTSLFPPTTLMISPGLGTFIGTEVGVFDYLLSLRPEIFTQLWKGGVVQARWDIPVDWSDNLNSGQVYAGSKSNARMDRLMLFQGVRLAPGLMASIGAGLVLHDIYGTLNEVIWQPGNGNHRFRVNQAWARNSVSNRTTDVMLGSYRYFFAPLDLSLEATAGKFWWQDRGYSVEMKRFFGDTAISALYKNSTTSEGKHWQVAGIQFSFPLTPRKDLRIGPLVISGTDEWSYSQETTLAIGGQTTNDVLTTPLAVNPLPATALYRAYYNRDRLNSSYIKQHLDRLREAWLTYKD